MAIGQPVAVDVFGPTVTTLVTIKTGLSGPREHDERGIVMLIGGFQG